MATTIEGLEQLISDVVTDRDRLRSMSTEQALKLNLTASVVMAARAVDELYRDDLIYGNSEGQRALKKLLHALAEHDRDVERLARRRKP